MKDLQRKISDTLANPEEYLLGFADLGELLRPAFTYRYAVVIGKHLADAVIDGIENGPNAAYYELYKAANSELNEASARISKILSAEKIPHLWIRPTVADSELQGELGRTLRYPFSHKMAATRSGLGWIGKCDLLVTKKFGPRLRLASILTAFPVSESGAPIERSRCGKCAVCVERCPARAASGKPWNTAVDRDEFFSAPACRSACRELSRRNLGLDISICGICVSVCPIGKKGQSG